MARLTLRNLSKHFGDVKAVDDLSLTVEDGEFLTFLGPSGCGKSTTLFAIAGLDTPTSGQIVLDETAFFDSNASTNIAPERRNCGLVFQSYALWPHMTVEKNLAFPLELRRIAKHKRREMILEALELVEMEDYLSRYPHELSGGQQQRVALARTLVYQPKLLLLDEPLSNLDAKLRNRARQWLKELQQRLAVTTIYVTHDQSEALSLSDRIAVMDGGKFAQLGTPEEIYRTPASSFVADFIGASNFLEGIVADCSDREATIDVGQQSMITAIPRGKLQQGSKTRVALRPEDIRFVRNGEKLLAGENSIAGQLKSREYLGSRFQYVLSIGDSEVRVEVEDDLPLGAARIAFSSDSCIAFEE